MAPPPRKRRRISASSGLPLFDPVPASPEGISSHQDGPLSGARTVPQGLDDVQMHIQRRAVTLKKDEAADVQKRQTAYEISTINVNGSSIITTITVGLDAGAATSTGPTAQSPTTTPQVETTSTGSAATGGRVSVAAASTNSTKSGRSSARSTNTADTTLPSIFKATLTNGNVRTITRSSSAYLTTFPDGEVSTVCNVNDQCRLAATTSNQSSTGSTGSTASSGSSAAAAGGGGAVSSQHHNDDDGGGRGSTSLASIAGGVVGGLAGLALLLVAALIFLRWYKRRKEQGHQPLGRGTPEPDSQSSPTHPGMSERTALAPAIFSYQNKSVEASGSGASGFQKVSGRKMPPAYAVHPAHRDFESPEPDVPTTAPAQDLNNTTFYRDSYGFYAGNGTHTDEPQESPEPTPGSDQISGEMTLSPGPQRRPTVVNDPGPYVITPSSGSPETPAAHARSPSGPAGIGLSPFLERSGTPTTARSGTPSSIPDNRSSRFTEDF